MEFMDCENHIDLMKAPVLMRVVSLGDQTVKNLPAMQETWVPSLGWEDSLVEGHGNPLQYSCLENPMDRGAWWAAVQGVQQGRTQLSALGKTI